MIGMNRMTSARTKELTTVPTEEHTEWQIAIAYDIPAARDRAMRLSQSLQKKFSDEIIISCTWWRFRYLEDPDIALVARHYATAADIIIFSTNAAGLFPLQVMNWIESWASARRKPHGLLVPLIGSPNIPAQVYSTKLFYLRHVADRAKMEFLTQSAIEANLDQLPTNHRVGKGADPGQTLNR